MKLKKVYLLVFLLIISTPYNIDGSDNSEFERYIVNLVDKKNLNSSRLKALIGLEELRDPKAEPYVIDALRDKNFPYRLQAIHTLGSLGGINSLVFLNKLLTDLDNEKTSPSEAEKYTSIISQKAFAIAALYKLGDKSKVDFLYRSIKDDNKIIRYNIATALGMVENNKTKEVLYDVLHNDDMELPKCGAALALIELRDPKIVSVLKDMMQNGKGALCFESILERSVNNGPECQKKANGGNILK